jgi:phospholipid/cholesterol/gamma-HCH transport system substrate-binding protein
VNTLGSALSRLALFVLVCLLALFALLAVFAQLRFEQDRTYRANFVNVGGLADGDFVRIAGVEVGKVKKLSLQPDTSVLVDFTTDPSVVLTHGSRAVIRYDNLIGGRYLALEQGADSTKKLNAGETIPRTNTAPPLDLDALIGGFRPLFRALDPDQVNALSGQIIRAFQGEGDTIGSLLSQTATLTNTLADRDELIGQVITNLNTVLGSLSDQSKKFDTAVENLSTFVKTLADRKQDIANAVAYTNAAAGSVADFLATSRPQIQKVVHETDRSSAIIAADHDYVDDLLNTLPDTYKILARQGLYGNFVVQYLCGITLKVNGKGGQPVYIKVAEQTTGRCAPR